MYPATDQISPSMSPRPNASFVSMSSQSNAADRKSTRLNSSHLVISYAVFCLKKKKIIYHYQCNPSTKHCCLKVPSLWRGQHQVRACSYPIDSVMSSTNAA